MTWRRTAITLAMVSGMVVFLPFLQVARGIGHFDLTIEVDPSQPIDEAAMRFSVCWNQQYLTNVLETGTPTEGEWTAGHSVSAEHFQIEVPYSTRTGPFHIESSYVQPQFLVVEYSLSNPQRQVRKAFPIPEGRGARSMLVTVP